MRALSYAVAALLALAFGLVLHYAGWAKDVSTAKDDAPAVAGDARADGNGAAGESLLRSAGDTADPFADGPDRVRLAVARDPHDEDAITEAVLTDFAERLKEQVDRRKAERMRAFEAPNAAAAARLSRSPGFAYATLDEPAFPGGTMRRISFLQASLLRPRFQEATLEHADFTGAFLLGPNFADATLRDVRFIGARIEDADFRDAALKRTRFDAAQIKHADFRGAALEDAVFDGAYLQNVAFAGAHLGDASFYGAVLDRVDFTGAPPPASAFAGACLIAGTPPRGVIVPPCEERASE